MYYSGFVFSLSTAVVSPAHPPPLAFLTLLNDGALHEPLALVLRLRRRRGPAVTPAHLAFLPDRSLSPWRYLKVGKNALGVYQRPFHEHL